MSGWRAQLEDQIARFDDAALEVLANRGLLRRAYKDLERLSVELTEEGEASLVVQVGPQRVVLDAGGPAQARCDCTATGVCQHILAALIGLKRSAATRTHAGLQAEVNASTETDEDPVAPLRDALLRLPAAALIQHAGKAGYRWAWHYLQDLEEREAVRFSGDRHLVLTLHRPRLTLRYMGGGLDNLVADVDLPQLKKYQVAAVLAFQRAHGGVLVPPEPTTAGVGTGHGFGGSDEGDPGGAGQGAAAELAASRQRLRDAARVLLAESVELGLSHLSSGLQERWVTLAVWAQGADYPRLALLMRRIADHIELLLQRAGGADEHRLLDELSLGLALVDALESHAARGRAPVALVGRARTQYAEVGTLEVLGLGARPWRSASGYVGLTMLFWSARDGFMACTEARPAAPGTFDPKARYHAPAPWGGLITPAHATGQRLILTRAHLNDAMRLSPRQSTQATVLPELPASWAPEQFRPWVRWSALAEHRAASASLLRPRPPMEDWVVLQPRRVGPAGFDDVRQTMVWPLWDDQDQRLMAELPFDSCSDTALRRIEALPVGAVSPGWMLVAQVQRRGGRLVVEPLSVIRPDATPVVDALFFEPQAPSRLPSQAGDTLSGRPASDVTADPPMDSPDESVPDALADLDSPGLAPVGTPLGNLRQRLQRWAERGVAGDSGARLSAEWSTLATEAQTAGLTAFAALDCNQRPGVVVLRFNFVRMSYDAMFSAGAPRGESRQG